MKRARKSVIPPQRESAFRQDVADLLTLNGWLVYWTWRSDHSPKGYPDICAAHPEHGVFWSELKIGRNKPTKAQEKWLAVLRASGQRAWVWRPEDWDAIKAVAQGKQ